MALALARVVFDAPARRVAVVVMGVAGCGKTTVAQGIAAACRESIGSSAVGITVEFIEADDLHPAGNVTKMARGEPLTDADRAPWLAAIAARLHRPPPDAAAGGSVPTIVVATCSALKRSYRDTLRSGGGAGVAKAPVIFLHLDLPHAAALERVRRRRGHFAGAALVASQFDALEAPRAGEPGVCVVPVRARDTPSTVLARAVAAVSNAAASATHRSRL